MTEESKLQKGPEKPKIIIPDPCIGDTMKAHSHATSSFPSSPLGLRKISTPIRTNCLCSPTTHAGSFRCRYHRTNCGLRRSSLSVGSKLSELQGKSTDQMCGSLQAGLTASHNKEDS